MRLILLVLLGVAIGCGSDEDGGSDSVQAVTVQEDQEGWTRSRKVAVRWECERAAVENGNPARASVVYCDCAIGAIESTYRYDYFFENEFVVLGELQENGIIDACKNKSDELLALTRRVNDEDFYSDFPILND